MVRVYTGFAQNKFCIISSYRINPFSLFEPFRVFKRQLYKHLGFIFFQISKMQVSYVRILTDENEERR